MDNKTRFIEIMFLKFVTDRELIERFSNLETYIIYHLDKMITAGDMADQTGQQIFNKIYPVADHLLGELGL